MVLRQLLSPQLPPPPSQLQLPRLSQLPPLPLQ
jgi:hypothetical protein